LIKYKSKFKFEDRVKVTTRWVFNICEPLE